MTGRDDKIDYVDLYLVALRIIQPGRLQDIILEMQRLAVKADFEVLNKMARVIHDKMRDSGRLVSVRKGTYILTEEGMRVVAQHRKERNVDNVRMFLMKQQRKRYSRNARWLG